MKRTETVEIDGWAITATWDATPAPGATVDDLGHGVTVVRRDPPPARAGLPAGREWIAPYAVNCAEHGWQVSRRTADECAAEGREHVTRDHAEETRDRILQATAPRRADESAQRLARYARGDVGYRLLG